MAAEPVDEAALNAFRARTREVWGLGDYTRIADMIRPAARALVDACAISAGQEVLDVAAGSGNVAVLAAEEGARVVASDISPGQVRLGSSRTAAEGLDVEWVEADAEALPFEDERFDCCTSVFGAMFAPRPEIAASEMFRVLRPGGTFGMAVWGTFGFQGEMFEMTSEYVPALPEGVPSPREWAREDVARARLEGLASSIEIERRSMRWEFPSVEALFEVYRAGGPNVAAERAMEPEQQAEMAQRATEIVRRWDRGDGSSLLLEPEYVQIVARKRG